MKLKFFGLLTVALTGIGAGPREDSRTPRWLVVNGQRVEFVERGGFRSALATVDSSLSELTVLDENQQELARVGISEPDRRGTVVVSEDDGGRFQMRWLPKEKDGAVAEGVSFWRWPQGAVKSGTRVVLGARTVRGDAGRVVLELRKHVLVPEAPPRAGEFVTEVVPFAPAGPSGEGFHDAWTLERTFSEPGMYAYSVFAEDGGVRRLVAEGRLTIFDPKFSTPEWSKNGIMYQVFPDRFHNGDPRNDLRTGAEAEYHDGYLGKTVRIPLRGKGNVMLNANWDEPVTAWGKTDASACDYIDGRRFYGGDLQGILDKLDHFESLGVTVLYLNPIFPSPTTHRYDPVSFHGVDPRLGTPELFKKLTTEARKRGIRIILDITPDHTSDQSLFFDAGSHFSTQGAHEARTSPYSSWYTFQKWPTEWKSWWGFSAMPTIRVNEPSYQKFFLDGKNSVLDYWRDLGAAGWRVDVASEVPMGFLRNLRTEFKKDQRDGYLVGEVWSNPVEATSMLVGDSFDGAMNYRIRSLLLNDWDRDHLGEKPEFQGFFLRKDMTAAEFWKGFQEVRDDYPREAFFAMMNLVASHDAARPQFYLRRAWGDQALAAQKALAFFQYGIPGMPHIYYGDEAGLDNGGEPGCKKDRPPSDDPFMRRPYPWGKENQDLLAWYRQLGALRKAHAALRTGEMEPLPNDSRALAWARFDDSSTHFALANITDKKTEVSLDLGAHVGSSALLKGLVGSGASVSNGKLTLTLAPFEVRLLQWDKPSLKARPLKVKAAWHGKIDAVVVEYAGRAAIERVDLTSGDVRTFETAGPLSDRSVVPGHDYLYRVSSPAAGRGEAHVRVPGSEPGWLRATPTAEPTQQGDLFKWEMEDPAGDDVGPGTYAYPTNEVFRKGDFDLLKVSLSAGTNQHEMRLTLANGDNVWKSASGLSKATLWVFFDLNPQEGTVTMPEGLNAQFDESFRWDRAVQLEGWEPRFFRVDSGEISAKAAGEAGVQVSATPGSPSEVTLKIPADALGSLTRSAAVAVFVTGQDGYGPGRVRQVEAGKAEWRFGGASAVKAPAIIDLLARGGEAQKAMLTANRVKGLVLSAKP